VADIPPLRRSELQLDPVRQFTLWYEAAEAADPTEADTMALATAAADDRPAARMVLLECLDDRGFVFFTHYDSRKGRELAANPEAAILFYWPESRRQVRIAGRVERLTPAEADAAFARLPRDQQLSFTACPQGEVVADRAELQDRLARAEREHRGRVVPRPADWGGYRLRPVEFEFWQQGEDWLNDVFRYRRAGDGPWTLERLAP
jgi:pyridoxamine 5'-phosphate oxidase